MRFEAGLDGVTFQSKGCKLLGGLYKAAGEGPRPTAVLLHGVPGVEKQLDIAYALRDLGWNCLYFHFRGSLGSEGAYSFAGLAEDTEAAVEWALRQPSVDKDRIALIGGSMTGDKDELFPPPHYTEFLAVLPATRWARAEEGDHALSTCRPWLVRTVTEWLIETLGS